MDEATEPPPAATPWSDVLGGAGMGLLLGTLVGLSSSPVVGVVVGALASVLAIFLGLDATAGSALGALRVNGPRIGALGAATVVGLGLGLWVRVTNPFLPDPAAQLARWQAALPDDPTLAKQMMVLERTGVAPSRFQYGDEPPSEDVEVAAQEGAAARQAVLFSTLGDFNACSRLDPARFATPADVLPAYARRGAPAGLPEFAELIAALPEADLAVAVATAHELLCALQRAEAP
jgi:hypothetical protein